MVTTEFPILRDWSCRLLSGARTSIPWAMIAPHEAQARRNHGGQDLAELARRGGLDPAEAIAVLEDRPWRGLPREEAERRIEELVAAWREEIANLPLGWWNRTLGGRFHWMAHHAPDVALCGRTIPENLDEGDASVPPCAACLAESEQLLAQLPPAARNRDLWTITGEPPLGWR